MESRESNGDHDEKAVNVAKLVRMLFESMGLFMCGYEICLLESYCIYVVEPCRSSWQRESGSNWR